MMRFRRSALSLDADEEERDRGVDGVDERSSTASSMTEISKAKAVGMDFGG